MDVPQDRAGLDDAVADGGILALPAFAKGVRIRFVSVPAPDHLDALLQIVNGANIHGQAEPVEQLRAQVAFFRIAAAHEREAGGVPDAEAFAFNHVDTGGSSVKQQIDKVIFQKNDLVDVKKDTVSSSQRPGFKVLLARDERFFEIERAADPVLGCPERQVNHGRPDLDRFRRFSATAHAADRTGVLGTRRFAIEPAAGSGLDFRKQFRQGAHGGGFAGPPVAENEDTTQKRLHGCHQQRLLDVLLGNDRRKGKRF